MACFDITPEQLKAYKKSIAGMSKIRKRLKMRIHRNKENSLDNEYKLELLNVVDGYMKAVVRNSDKRYSFQNRS